VINNRPVGRGVTGLLRFLFDQAGFLGHKGGNKVLPFLDSVRRRDPIRIEPDFFFVRAGFACRAERFPPTKFVAWSRFEPRKGRKAPQIRCHPTKSLNASSYLIAG
jgi:hypothetical protein